jgi:pimeloyl-ACP methyl ester carboxylesterase
MFRISTTGTLAGQSPQVIKARAWTGWTGRLLAWLLAGLLVLALTGVVYQTIGTDIDLRTYPAPGQMVDVGGHRLHIQCRGEGTPTVLLDAAGQASSAHWQWVQPETAKITRVCAYDRAGMGWSEVGPEPRDGNQIAAELHTLLQNAGIAGPYVLVGHSLGGLYVRAYQANYPDEVVGMVLVDATHPDLWQRLPPELAKLPSASEADLWPWMARLGITRLINAFPVPTELPEAQHGQVAAANASTKFMVGFAGEIKAMADTTAALRADKELGVLPLYVLTSASVYAQQPPEIATVADQTWQLLQEELATLSRDTIHQVVAGSTHESLVFEQMDAQATIAAIEQMVTAVRSGRPLASLQP